MNDSTGFPTALPFPTGVTVSCDGNGKLPGLFFGSGGLCADTERIAVTASPGQDVFDSLNVTGSFTITNTADEALPYEFAFDIEWTPLPIDGVVTDTATEFAETSSSILGTGGVRGFGQTISCSAGNGNPAECNRGIDYSDDNGVFTLGPDQSITENFDIALSVQAKSAPVPEPPTLPFFLAGAVGVFAFGIRRRLKAV